MSYKISYIRISVPPELELEYLQNAVGESYWKSVTLDATVPQRFKSRPNQGTPDGDKNLNPRKLWHINLYIQPWRPPLVDETDTLKVLTAS